MFTKKITILFLLSMYFISCTIEDSSDVNQQKIYADYDLRYDANSDKTRVVARFRFGGATGTLLQLTGDAQVLFKGDKLPFQTVFGGHTKEYAGEISTGSFEYTNTEFDVVINEIPTYESIGFPDDLSEVSKSGSYELSWKGKPLSVDQRAAVFIGSWTWGQDALFIEDGDGTTSVILGKDKLAQVATGNTTFYLERTTATDIGQGTPEGGRIRSSYRGINKSVEVTE
jgi:hypothetical protein